MKKLISFFKIAREELDKVIFPTKGQITSAFISVFVVVLVITLFLYLADLVIGAVVGSIL